MYPKKCNKLALCQISQIVRVWVMKVWVSKYFEPPSVSHQAFPSNSESFPSNLESSVIFGAHSGEHGTRCVWNRWDLKFYVNSCVKMSSAHVSLVTCGIFPCEPNLDWRVTISKVWSFWPRVILSFMGLAVKDGLKFCHAAMISPEPSPYWKVKVSSSGFKVQLKCMWCPAVHLFNPSI